MAESLLIGPWVVAVKSLIEISLHWKDVTDETRNFLINLRQVDDKVNTARRLRRMKSELLDSHTKREVDADIWTAAQILVEIGKTIENNRLDIDLYDSVGTWNKLKWLFRGQAGFLAHQTTLNASLITLTCSITRMECVQWPSAGPPSYKASTSFSAPLIPPSARRRNASESASTRNAVPPPISSRSHYDGISQPDWSPPEVVVSNTHQPHIYQRQIKDDGRRFDYSPQIERIPSYVSSLEPCLHEPRSQVSLVSSLDDHVPRQRAGSEVFSDLPEVVDNQASIPTNSGNSFGSLRRRRCSAIR